MIDLLLGNLDLVLEADGDGKRIRDAILQLAVRGRLVAQETGDGDARARLGSVIQLISGRHLKSDQYNESGHGIPYSTGPSDFVNGSLQISRWTEAREAVATEGDVLLTVKGSGVGSTCVARVPEVAISRQLMALRAKVGDASFLAITATSLQGEFSGAKRGVAIPGISRGDVLDQEVYWPPLAEQHRIVAKVDELMGHAAVVEERHLAATSARVRFRDAALHELAEAEDHEAVEAAWSRIADHFDDLFTEPEDIQPLRQTILQLAVRGRLVAQESGADQQEIGSVAPGMPQGWRMAPFDQLARVASALVDPGDHPNAVHVAPDTIEAATGRLLECRTIAEDGVKSSKHRFFKGQILYSKIRPALSKCVIAPFDGLCSADMYPIETTQVVPFVHLVMLTPDFVSTASAMANRVKMPKINKTELGTIEFPLPPLAEQHRIVAKVDELMALCDTLEASLTRAKTTREQFAASISHSLTAPAASAT